MKRNFLVFLMLCLTPLSSFAFAIKNNTTYGVLIWGDKGHYSTFVPANEYDKGWYYNDQITLTSCWASWNMINGYYTCIDNNTASIDVSAHALVCVSGNVYNDDTPTLSIGDC